ncbi:hypothetical protein AGDE_13678 [Angomonas deanei]|uniref:Uncharacterized protein n=1 Tax=Angomonas deanei TaxID=59799 RepID=A0A7G2CJW6_9TRYP|nr:hypothetical protein AGDE_13678 [Angomonas deanei]CAD2220096.1 hypothetical protein, conserved [Angomonas deanei]|eukprot:EPY21958.1 hypothetical protein AGDE_13678 [Angomonas deanei]
MLAVPDDKRGVPPELLNDVRLELMCTDDVVVRGDQPEHKGTYYVCVVLGERLESLGLTGSDVVPQLTVPGVEVERFPQYFWGSIVALSILNTIILPLSVFQNLVEWVDWVDLEEGTAYIFVFSMATLFISGALGRCW